MKNKDTKKVVGAIVFKSHEELAKAGHYDYNENNIVLVYAENNEDISSEKLFYKETDFTETPEYFYAPGYTIEKRYTMEEAREEYPELFL